MMASPSDRLARHPRRKRPGSPRFQLRMVPMIDVVFLLLVFFLLAANFRPREGFLPAELPRYVTHAEQMELEPLLVQLQSQTDGACQVAIGNDVRFVIPAHAQGGFQLLSRNVRGVIDAHGRHLDDPVKLVPTRQTRWDHVVKAYDALWEIELRNIIFALVD